MPDFVLVFSDSDTVNAQLMANRLRDHGLSPILQGENLGATIGAWSVLVPCRVLVPAAEESEALAAIAVFQSEEELGDETADQTLTGTKCPACAADWEPGFSACWNCGQAAPEEAT